MVKECRVILNNECCTVVRFDNTDIQFPAIGKNVEKVFVKNGNGRYTIVKNPELELSVPNSENDAAITKSKKKAPKNKTTVVKELTEESNDASAIV